MALAASSLPSWLPQVSAAAQSQQTASELGAVAGTYLGGLRNYLTKSQETTDPDTGKPQLDDSGNAVMERPSWRDAFKNSALSQRDPQWKLKEAQSRANTWSTIAGTERQWQEFNNTAKESEGKTTDMPILNEGLSGLKTDPNFVLSKPLQSQWGITQWERMQRDARQAQVSKQRADAQQQRQSSITQWDQAIAAADPETRAAIDALPDQGYNVDADGNRLSPTVDAMSLYNKAVTQDNQFPERRFGYKPNAVETAKTRTEGQLEVGKQRLARPQSSLGKLEADKALALQSGAPEEVIAAYDGAIKKASAADGLYAGSPEVIEAGGKQFLKWGKQLRDITGQDTQKKAQLSILESKIKTLQSAVIKYEDTPEKQNAKGSLSGQLKAATDELKKLFETLPAAPAPAAVTSRPASTPVTAPSGATFSIAPAP